LALEIKPEKLGQKTRVLDSYENPPGVNARVDLNTLIRNVFVSPAAQPWYVEIVSSILQKFGYGSVPVVQSNLYTLK
jgi:hypothetical protein